MDLTTLDLNKGNAIFALGLWLLGQPFVIMFVTHWLKTFPFVQKNPKETAAILNVIANVVVGSLLFHSLPTTANQALVHAIVLVAQAVGGSTGMYEWIQPKTGNAAPPSTLPPKP
jgi:hypothetical protein